MAHARLIASLAVLTLFVACPLAAGEVTPFLTAGRIGVRIRDMRFPPTLGKELTSGLTNRILVRVVLLADAQPAGQRAVEMAVKYDLWDENFRVTVAVDERVIRDEMLANLDQALAFVRDTRLPDLFSASALPTATPLQVNVDVLLNPIEKERMDRIRKWVAENSAQAPVDPTRADSGAPVGASMSNALFNRIFEQYASGRSVVAAWHETASSRPFTLEGLQNDRQ
jgi:hypothetical protein